VDSQDKRQGGQRQGNRQEKVYQPKTGGLQAQNGDTNAQSPKENRKRDKKARQKENGSGKKPQKGEDQKSGTPTINERLDNSSLVDGIEINNPHRAHQVAEASRIQQLVPTGISREDQEKVKKIQEVVGKNVELHIIYGVLEEFNFDVDRTVSYFIEKLQQEKDSGKLQTAARWSSVVKKGIKTEYADEPHSQEPPKPAHKETKQPAKQTAPPQQPTQPVAQPNMGFLKQLRLYEKRVLQESNTSEVQTESSA